MRVPSSSRGSVLLVAAVLALDGCGSQDDHTAIVIGSLVPRTGPIANADWVTAIELGHDHMAQGLAMASHARGLHVGLVTRDSASNVDLSRQYAHELVALGAKALTAESSDSGKGANQANYDATPINTPILCFVCTNSNLNNRSYTDPDPLAQAALRDEANWLFRTAATTVNHTELTVKSILALPGGGDVNGDGTVKIVLVSSTDSSSLASTETSVKLLESAVVSPARLLIEVLLIDKNATAESADFRGVLERAHDKITTREVLNPTTQAIETAASAPDDPSVLAPDIIWNKALTIFAVGLVKTYKSAGYTTKVIHADTFRRNSVLTALGPAAEGQEGLSVLSWENNASGEVFAQAQKARTDWEPAAYESNAYDARVMIELAAIKAALPLPDPTMVTPDQIRAALQSINDPNGTVIRTGPLELARAVDLMADGHPINYEGASGPVDFDERGDVRGKVAYWRVQGARFVDLSIYDCTRSNDCPRIQ